MNKSRAQTTAEYAILFAIVVGAFIAMQVYIERGLQGRIKDVVDARGAGGTIGSGTASGSVAFNTAQYEPYYLQSNAQTNQTSNETETTGLGGGVNKTSNQRTNVTREQQTLSVNGTGN
ncbi:MAG: hypothetical protein NT060_04580 [Candidatus Omnitrophica bacterium]|nr:hypothetical protein [Candidatus Omnitrophota bacterium]